MGRPPRITVANLSYHVLNRGNNKQVVFHDDEDYLYYLKLIRRYKEKFGFKLPHFSLMPNHVHLQMEPQKDGDLSRIMHRLTLAHTWYCNTKYKTVGHVWQGRFKNPLIDKDEYFLQCGLYIELNPVRAGLVQKPEDWTWSSYNFYAYDRKDVLIEEIIDPDPFYLELAENKVKRQEIYRKRIEEVLQEKVIKMMRDQFKEGAFGSPEFREHMDRSFGIGMERKRGRPRKK